MAHGWATGPTSALTEYVLGVAPTSPGGATWRFTPQPADLTFAQGRLTTTRGPIDASWRVAGKHVSMRVSAPAGTTGTIRVPGKAMTVWLDGKQVAQGDDVALDVPGGAHTIEAHPTAQTGTVGGSVPATLALTLGAPASFGPFAPGVVKDYTASTTAAVISTAGDAALTVTDPGHLANGSFTLPEALSVDVAPASWTQPVSNAPVAITFRQHVGATDALRTGTYSRTLTFTLSTTAP
jgi:alpha-L-rhamnosidase-like protein